MLAAASSKQSLKDSLQPFDFDEEVMEGFREKREIPLNFYNKEGQIIINKKEEASLAEIEGLLRFADRGIYYHEDDSGKLGKSSSKEKTVPGFTDTELLTKQTADNISDEIGGIVKKLKMSSMTTIQASGTNNKMLGIIQEFHQQPEAMFGLINIIELLQDRELSYEVDIAAKRTVVAMSLKMRAIRSFGNTIGASEEEEMAALMTASLLCDVSYAKMDIPKGKGLTPRQMEYIKHHPIYSYFLLAHDPNLPSEVKQMILLHHSPLLGKKLNNNYPDLKVIFNKFMQMKEKIGSNDRRKTLLNDMSLQMKWIEKKNYNLDNLGILNLASEFASLTSNVPWRKAMPPDLAIRMIINNSFFSHNRRVLNIFIDYLSPSLNRNKPVIDEGDFVLVMFRANDGKQYFEICKVAYMDRLQTRPGVSRFGYIRPRVSKSPGLKISDLDTSSIHRDPRKASFRLDRDESRQIVYIIDQRLNPELYEFVQSL